MSYSIYYDRAFVRVDGKYIPLVCSGSNNCFELIGRRKSPEKYWGVLNWKRDGQILFAEAEIREIAKDYDVYNQESGMIFKSRRRQFAPGEFERWVTGGMKRAYTIEEYCSFGNGFYVLDYSAQSADNRTRHPFSTTKELMTILGRLGGIREISVKMVNNRNVYRPINRRPRRAGLRACNLPECCVLAGEGIVGDIKGHTVYFVKPIRNGFRYVFQGGKDFAKAFGTEREAVRYLAKYADRLGKHANFKVVRFTKTGGAL
jgi:hypothetical protein